jgi:hypothetical protein
MRIINLLTDFIAAIKLIIVMKVILKFPNHLLILLIFLFLTANCVEEAPLISGRISPK